MNFGVVVLIVVAGWSLVSIVASLAFGAMASSRDVEPKPVRSVQDAHRVAENRNDAAHYHHLAS